MIEFFAPGKPMAESLEKLINALLLQPNRCLIVALSDDPCVPGAPCTRTEVVAELGDRLYEQIAFLEFEFGPEKEGRDGLDLPAFVRRRLPAVEPATILAYGLSDLPPNDRRQAMRALNLGREVIRDQGYSLVLWFSPDTVPEITFGAPDFWAWKNLTVEFPLPLSKLLDAPSPLARLGLREAGRLRHARRYYEETLATPAADPALTADLQLALSRVCEQLGEVEKARALHQTALETLTGLGQLGQLRQTYFDWIVARYRWLDFRGLQQVRNIVRLPLDELFVPLWTMSEPAGEEGARPAGRAASLMGLEAAARLEMGSERVELRRALAQRRQAVILGEPGSGKTTLLKYLALSLALGRIEQTGLADSDGDWLPLLVPISEFAAACRADPPLTLQAYLPRYFARQGLPDLQPLIAPALAHNRALLLLDGLDEVATIGQRREMAARVTAFVQAHPQVRLALTSRTAGYDRSELRLEDLAHLTILEFNDDDLETFVGQWCRAWEESDPERGRRSDDQVAASAAEHQGALLQAIADAPHVRALAANPLMVTILALIHYQNVRLPEQRAELYRLCVEALAETWNQVRSLSGRPIDVWLGDRRLDESLAVRLLAPLASWLHDQARESGLIERQELITHLTATILEREDLTDARAEEVAADFVRLICQHSGLLVERGPGQFAFMHLTFQEYLAARYLARRRNREELTVRRMGDPRWREVILLAAAILEGDDRDDLVLALLRAGADAADGESRGQGVELAGAALADLGHGQVSRRVWRQVADALTALVEESIPQRQAPVPLRVAAGLALGALGDPRPGVTGLFPLLVEVPGGPFLMGSSPQEVQRWKDWTRRAIEDGRYTTPEGWTKERLFEALAVWLEAEEGIHEIDVPAFYVARYPVTNTQFAPFVDKETGGYDDPAFWAEAGWAWRQGKGEGWGRPPERRDEPMYWRDARFDRPNQPVVGVTWFEAMAYARWLTHQWRMANGEWRIWQNDRVEPFDRPLDLQTSDPEFRLPAEAEWEKAARGDDGRTWPWGNEWDEKKANTAEGRGDWTTTPAGLYPGGASPYGVLDLVGNVWEWTSTRWGEDWQKPDYDPPYRPDDGRESPEGTALRVLRGGSWNSSLDLARCAARNGNIPLNSYSFIGFRLASPICSGF